MKEGDVIAKGVAGRVGSEGGGLQEQKSRFSRWVFTYSPTTAYAGSCSETSRKLGCLLSSLSVCGLRWAPMKITNRLS